MKTQNTKELKHGEAILSKPSKKEATLQTLFNREYKKWQKKTSIACDSTFMFRYKEVIFSAEEVGNFEFIYECCAGTKPIYSSKANKYVSEYDSIPVMLKFREDVDFKTRLFNWIEETLNSYYAEKDVKHGEAITLNNEVVEAKKYTTIIHKSICELLGIDLEKFQPYIINKWFEPGQKMVEFSFKNEEELFDVSALIFKYATRKNLRYASSVIKTFVDEFQLK